MFVPAIVLDVLGTAIWLMQQAEFDFKGAPPRREDDLAVGRVNRRVRVHMIDRPAGATMTRPGDDLSQLGMQVVARGDPAGTDDLGRLPLL